MAFGKRTGAADIASGAKYADLEALLEQMIAQGERVFHASLAVLLRSNDEENLRQKVAETLATLRELGGAEGFEEGVAAFPLFAELSLPNARSKERMKRMKTTNLAQPTADIWAVARSRRAAGAPTVAPWLDVSLDPFDPSLTNANQLVSGASGAANRF